MHLNECFMHVSASLPAALPHRWTASVAHPVHRRHGLCVADLRRTQPNAAQRVQPLAALSERSSSVPDRSAAMVAAATDRSGSVRTAASATVANPPSADTETPAAQVDDTIGVLLLNLGGPETLEDVQPFLYNLFADPDIIRLPSYARFLQPVVAKVISTLRAPKSSEGYQAIGGGSPLRKITLQQADALSESLRRKGQPNNVYVAMRYWKPFTEDAIAQVKADGVKKLVVLPLYPQFSISTSGSSLRLLESLFKEDPALSGLLHTVIPSWYHRPGYITAMSDLIETELGKFECDQKTVEIFFSAHGVPKSYVEEAGDPYKAEMEECIKFICNELKRRGVKNSHTLAYQSRVGPVEWLKPYTDDSIRQLGQAGCRAMLAVPVSFVSEHIETLDEMDVEYRELAEASGITSWRRVPALNTNPVFVDDLADAVVEALPYAGSMAGSNPSNAMVPQGDVEALLETYDKERRVLPMPLTQWKWGWTQSAETWNGRIAMLAIVIVIVLETITGQGVLNGRID